MFGALVAPVFVGEARMFRWSGFFLLVLVLLAGCSGKEKKSELLTLLGVDEKIVDSNQDVSDIYDALTLLKRGEAYFLKEEYTEAVMEFDRFLLLHPFHRMAAFAQFKLAMSYNEQINTLDRDPAPMEKAVAAFQKLLSQYPQSLYVDEANEKVAALNQRQAKYQFLVGHFYYKKASYPAAISRFEKILKKSVGKTLDEKTLYFLGLSQFKLGNSKAASTSFRRLRDKYPHSDYLQELEDLQLGSEALLPADTIPSAS